MREVRKVLLGRYEYTLFSERGRYWVMWSLRKTE